MRPCPRTAHNVSVCTAAGREAGRAPSEQVVGRAIRRGRQARTCPTAGTSAPGGEIGVASWTPERRRTQRGAPKRVRTIDGADTNLVNARTAQKG